MKAPKRPQKTAGLAIYKAHLERLKAETGVRQSNGATTQICVFAATCSGSTALGRSIGLPLAVLGMARDPESAVRRLNERRHGSCVPFFSLSQAFDSEDGWDDWAILKLGTAMVGTDRLSVGISIGRGVFTLSTRGDAPVADMRSALAVSLRHMRLQEVTSTGKMVLARQSVGAPLVVASRYTHTDHMGYKVYRRVDDLYAFDPWTDLAWLGLTIEAAALSAGATIAAMRR